MNKLTEKTRKIIDKVLEISICYKRSMPLEKRVATLQNVKRHDIVRTLKDNDLGWLLNNKKGLAGVLTWYDPEVFNQNNETHVDDFKFAPASWWKNPQNCRKAIQHSLGLAAA